MKLSLAHEYDYDLQVVWAAFTDAGFIQAKYEGVGARAIRIQQCSESDEGFDLVVEREVELDAPALLQSFLGAWNKVVQTEHWRQVHGEYVNEFSVSSAGIPVNIEGVGLLKRDDEGCIYEIDVHITSEVPLVGNKLAQFVAESTERSLDEEFDYISEHLEPYA